MLAFCFDSKAAGSPLQPTLGPACDQCRRKKARCNRRQPCQTCAKHGISCAYQDIPKPRGRRRRVAWRSARAESSAELLDSGRIQQSEERGSHTSQALATCLTEDGTASTLSPESEGFEHGSAALSLSLSDLAADGQLLDDNGTAPSCYSSASSAERMEHLDALTPFDWSSTVDICSPENTFTDPSLGGPHGCVNDTCTSGCTKTSRPPLPTPSSQPPSLRLQVRHFRPYVRVFLDTLYPVFPIIDGHELYRLLDSIERGEQHFDPGLYACLASLSAAVMVQLNLGGAATPPCASSTQQEHGDAESRIGSASSPDRQSGLVLECASTVGGSMPTAQIFVSQCRETRRQLDFITCVDEWTILTSFFLFAYYGNLDQSGSAWYYLRETIGFVQALRLDEEETYAGLDVTTAQRRRRLFWLVFITERAYALQHRRRAVLRPDIDLPGIFEAREPRLIYGFTTLAKLFASIDDSFVTAWSLQITDGRETSPSWSSSSLTSDTSSGNNVDKVGSDAKQQRRIRMTGGGMDLLLMSEIEETQRVDIMVTENWLRMLEYQLGRGSKASAINLCKSVAQIVSSAPRHVLHSHGIGMEQKVSDLANCLCDIVSAPGSSQNRYGPEYALASDYLHNFMKFLAEFRNHESRYFWPLVQRAGLVLDAQISISALPFFADGFVELAETDEQDENRIMAGQIHNEVTWLM